MSRHTNIITPIREDIAVFRAVLAAGLQPTDMVLNGVWRWFHDVEIAVPLPVMDLSDTERASLAHDIITEMDTVFASLEAQCAGKSLRRQNALTSSPEALQVNALWKELAGCFAELVNEEIPEIPEEIRAHVYASMVSDLAEKYGIDEDELRGRIRSDEPLRMMFRLNGLNPDEIR